MQLLTPWIVDFYAVIVANGTEADDFRSCVVSVRNHNKRNLIDRNWHDSQDSAAMRRNVCGANDLTNGKDSKNLLAVGVRDGEFA